MPQNKAFQNAKWIIACKVVQSLIQMVIGMITARYLGPSNYGLISYAASIVAFAVPVMQLGMRSTLVQEYVTRPGEEGRILGTSLGMNLVSALACMAGVVGFVSVANHGDKTAIAVCALYSVSILFQATEMLQYWFQAKLLSKYSSLAMLGAYVAVSAYKIYLLVSGKSVYWFALSHSVEYSMTSLLLITAYKRVGGQRVAFSTQLAKEMFSRSKYYILANLMVTIFQNTDHVMLKLMAGDAENGFYTTAATCAGVANFVYMAILDSGRPVILEKRQESSAAFESSVSRLYAILIYLTLAQSILFVPMAKLIVSVLYGREYLPAVQVLQIIVWQVPFSFMGSVRNIWILAEEKHNLLWLINLCGVFANVLLNALMIPRWGACGAAFASVLTQFITNFVVGFFMKSIRPNNRLLLKGLDPRCILEVLPKMRQTNEK